MTFNPPPGDPNRPAQQPYGAYPPPPPGYAPPAGATGTNGMAIAGFVLSFFCSLLGLIFSIIGLNQIKERNQGGRGLAIAGIIISVISILLAIIIVATRK